MANLTVLQRAVFADALEWKYGPVASCNLDAGTITVWNHPTLKKPTEAQITAALNEYQAEELPRRTVIDANSQIDTAAEDARAAFVTAGATQQAVYLLKAAEAVAVSAGATGSAAEHPILAASIGIEVPDTGDQAVDIAAVAVVVMAKRTQWLQIAAAIEGKRLGAKSKIAALSDPLDAAAVAAVVEGIAWPKP